MARKAGVRVLNVAPENGEKKSWSSSWSADFSGIYLSQVYVYVQLCSIIKCHIGHLYLWLHFFSAPYS